MAKWSIPLDKLAANAKSDVERVGRQATFALFDAVQQKSPVDTGRFRANWQFGKDAIPNGTVEADDKSGAQAQAEAAKALVTGLGGVLYYVNNLPYARRLEYGYSNQAPQGMVRLSVGEFRSAVAKAIK
jgi:hypothetical protein